MGRYYILRGGEIVEEPDFVKWAEWHANSYEKARSIVSTKVKYGTISTVFLGINMTLSRTDPPLLFETRVKGGWLDNEWERYPALEAARAGHEAWVARVRELEEENQLPPPGCPVW